MNPSARKTRLTATFAYASKWKTLDAYLDHDVVEHNRARAGFLSHYTKIVTCEHWCLGVQKGLTLSLEGAVSCEGVDC